MHVAPSTMSLPYNSNGTSSALPVPLQEKCQYPSKSCPQRRALKVDGELHRLCEFHRQLANRNQQRLQQRRRMLRQEKEYATTSAAPTTPTPQDVSPEIDYSAMEGLGELALEDLEILLQLLGTSDDGLLSM